MGTERTHCRTGTAGTTLSLRCAATSAMRRLVHEGQMQRPLQLKATSRFPYAVYYRVEHGVIVVLACLHSSRSPEVWRSR